MSIIIYILGLYRVLAKVKVSLLNIDFIFRMRSLLPGVPREKKQVLYWPTKVPFEGNFVTC